MRVAIAGLALESVSFLPGETGIDAFEREALRGPEMTAALRGQASVGGGFVRGLDEAGIEPLALVYTDCAAAGHASDAAFECYRDEICDGIARERARLDGVLLYLHGAMTTATRPCPETELAACARRALGAGKPLVLALDLHGNLAPELARHCDALFGFHYSPHVDMAETGLRAARCLAGMLRGEIAPRLTLRKAPVVLPSIFTATGLAPLSGIVKDSVRAPEQCPGVLDCSVFCGFAYADTPHIGFTVAAVSDRDPAPGEALAEELARRIWDQRQALLHEELVLPLEQGVGEALAVAATARPVVILEHADRLNDSTWVLRQLIARGAQDVAVPYLWDPIAAQAAIAAGEGAEIALEIGGRSSPAAGGPVSVRARVLFAGPKRFIGSGPMRRGRQSDLGPSALLDADGILISVISNQTTAIDLDALTQFGLDPRDFAIILLRSKTHFRAVYEPIAARIVIVETPDWGRSDLRSLPYRHVPLGVFPIDPAV
jgi:microcystin degradation protein MlrC